MTKRSTVLRWVRRHNAKHLCLCGCEQSIEIKFEHYRRGIPKYIKGHNFYGEHNPRTEGDVEDFRKSAAWEVLSEEEKQRRLKNLNSFGKMEEHPGWKGGRIVDDNGYIRIRLPEHPSAKDGYILEHRLVMEKYLAENYPNSPYLFMKGGKLYLRSKTVVHHVNEIKDDNEISNLFPFPDNAAHIFWHSSRLPDSDKIKRIKLGLYKTHIKEEMLETDDKNKED